MLLRPTPTMLDDYSGLVMVTATRRSHSSSGISASRYHLTFNGRKTPFRLKLDILKGLPPNDVPITTALTASLRVY